MSWTTIPLTAATLPDLASWFLDERVMTWSNGMLPLEEFYASNKDVPSRSMLWVEEEGVKLLYVDLDREPDGACELSVIVAPGHEKDVQVMQVLKEFLDQEIPVEFTELYTYVEEDDVLSRTLFTGLGFALQGDFEEGVGRFELRRPT